MPRYIKRSEIAAAIALVGGLLFASGTFNEPEKAAANNELSVYSPLDGSIIFDSNVELGALPPEATVQVAATPDPNTLDTAIDLPNITVLAVVDVEQKTRVNWFTVAGLLKEEMKARGLDYHQPTPVEVMDDVTTIATSTGNLIYPSNDYRSGQSVQSAFNNSAKFFKLKYSGDDILLEGLKTRDSLLKSGRKNISNGKIPNGMVDVKGIRVSSLISDPLEKTLDAIKNKYGIELHGYGGRGNQVDLRDTNSCGGNDRLSVKDMYSAPPKTCNPPTAVPGLSRHEKGLAVDFYTIDANGKATTVRGGVPFKALKEFAPQFGLKNLKSEPWHWSIDGN